MLLGTAIMLALERQCAGKAFRAIGEKTPENVFQFPRLKRLFPHAKLIALARDPRDVLTSAWHYFHRAPPGADEAEAKFAFIRGAVPSLNEGARTMLALAQQAPSSCLLVTYEAMHAATQEAAVRLFRFLGVADDAAVVADCVARTSFAALAGRRPDAAVPDRPFFRRGAVGDWRSTLTGEMNTLILAELGWMFPHFGWTP
jgi:hypothetical protein